MRSPRISEGHCALYGKDMSTATAHMNVWRNRLHNEQTGLPVRDMSGTNTSLSLQWNPTPSLEGSYPLASRKRASQLKQVQDLGVSHLRRGGAGDASANGGLAQFTTRAAAPRPPPAMAGAAGLPPTTTAAASAATVEKLASPRSFLDTETSRLQASAHARNLGMTFLRAGNLSQAKVYLARAEQVRAGHGSACFASRPPMASTPFPRFARPRSAPPTPHTPTPALALPQSG